uniref:Uncharacterized protein n=1 Tax=Anopheles farauti TaxID=69004 RepID=A0A182QQR1_9DIPT
MSTLLSTVCLDGGCSVGWESVGGSTGFEGARAAHAIPLNTGMLALASPSSSPVGREPSPLRSFLPPPPPPPPPAPVETTTPGTCPLRSRLPSRSPTRCVSLADSSEISIVISVRTPTDGRSTDSEPELPELPELDSSLFVSGCGTRFSFCVSTVT